jgi:hypothetical protein
MERPLLSIRLRRGESKRGADPTGLVMLRGTDRHRLVRRLPVPRQQRVQFIPFRLSRDNASQHIGQPGQRLEVIELGRLDQRGDDRPMMPTAVGPGEQRILATERHLGVILPISGEKLSCTIDGIHFMAAVCASNTASDAPMERSSMSRPHQALSRSWRPGCWIRLPVWGWRSEHRG